MAKYGTFKYGSGTKYGTGIAVSTPVLTGFITWIMQIDWAGSGFSGINEAQYCVGYELARGRRYYIAPDGNTFERMEPGTLTLVMENVDGRFDPYNINSLIYPNVKPGRKIFIYAQETATGITHPRFCGFITDIQPISGVSRVTITASDGIQWLMDQDITIPTMYQTTTTKAIQKVLSIAEFPFVSGIQTWNQPIPVFDPDQVNAYDVICDLAAGSLGTFFINASGGGKFYPLNYTAPSAAALDEDVLLKEINVAQPWETVRNIIRVYARRRGKRPLGQIWATSSPLYLAIGESSTFDISYAPAMNIASPVPRFDYYCWTSNDGTGIDIANQWNVILSNIGSISATVIITNNSSYNGYMTFLRILGREFAENIVSFQSVDVTSKGSGPNGYGPRRFNLQNAWLQDQGYAKAFSTLLKNFLKDPQKNPTIQIEQRPDLQFGFELMDKIPPLTSATLHINATYQVGGIGERWNTENGQSVTTVLHLQNIIYSTASITADPYYPGLDPIPEIPSPYLPPGWIIPPGVIPPDTELPPAQACITDMAAPPNGPFILPFSAGYYYPGMIRDAGFPCMLRSSAALNKSNIFIDGAAYQKWDGAAWVADEDNTWWDLAALRGGIEIVHAARPDTTAGGGPGLRGGNLLVGSPQNITSFRLTTQGGAADSILQYASKAATLAWEGITGTPRGSSAAANYMGAGIFECAANGTETNFSYWFAMKLAYQGSDLPYGQVYVDVTHLDGVVYQYGHGTDNIYEWGTQYRNDDNAATYGAFGSLYHWGTTSGAFQSPGLTTSTRICELWDPGSTVDRYILFGFHFETFVSTCHFRIDKIYWMASGTEYGIWAYNGNNMQYNKRINIKSIQANNICNHS
jgi:hypothetical protein